MNWVLKCCNPNEILEKFRKILNYDDIWNINSLFTATNVKFSRNLSILQKIICVIKSGRKVSKKFAKSAKTKKNLMIFSIYIFASEASKLSMASIKQKFRNDLQR